MTLIVYHRGGGKSLGCPPNCLYTIRWALNHGAEAIEYDTCLCRDGTHERMVVVEPALLAKHSLDVDDLLWSDVLALDAGNTRSGACHVATLAEVLDSVAGRAHQQIHLKGSNPRTVATVVEELAVTPDCMVTSFSLEVLREVKRASPRTRTGWLVKPDGRSGGEGMVDLTRRAAAEPVSPLGPSEAEAVAAKARGMDATLLCAPALTGEALSLLRGAGYEVGCWGVGSDLALARSLIGMGVDRFTIDNPEVL